MSIRAVGFDLDYTLAVPVRRRAELLAEAAEAVGVDPIERQAYLERHREHLTGESRAPIFEDLLAGEGRDETAEALAGAYRQAVNEAIEPVPGVEAMLADLRETYRVGLLTNGPVEAQRSKLETLGWTDAFDAVVVSGELEAGKPDPRPFDALCAALDADPASTAYVGDDPDFDVAGASAAGLATVQVTFDGGPAPDASADAHVDRESLPARLPGILRTLRS